MERVIITGGGWSGCAAAVQARKEGADVTLLERTDMLLGTGLVGGIMRNNGRFTAAEEMIAMGGGELFQVIEANLRHKNIKFPGHEHADLYDIGKIAGAVTRYLKEQGIHIHRKSRILHAEAEQGRLKSVTDDRGNTYEGDGFIDATGTAGPMNNCSRYGNGCAMCVLRCPSFGGRVSLTALAGIPEKMGKRPDGSIGSMSGSCKLYKESLSLELQKQLEQEGVAVIPVPEHLVEDHLDKKSCQQYALPEFRENMILLDTGHGKLMTPCFPLEKLQQIPGFENARYEDPYAGGKGNSMRFFAMAPRDNTLKVLGTENLFCCGEKSGLMVGHTEAIVTGVVAGHNCVLELRGRQRLELPDTLAAGDMISFVKQEMETKEGMERKYTFSGSCYFERMKEKGLYTADIAQIQKRVRDAGLEGCFLAG